MIKYGKRINIFCGNYGSGKTELSLNFVKEMAAIYQNTAIVDLDIINPYFRSRGEKEKLSPLGIKVISSVSGMEMADVPALSAAVYGVLQNKSYRTVLDIGGDDTGATVLGRFEKYFNIDEYQLFIIVNCNRPFTGTPEGVIQIIKDIERTSKLKATGLVNNTNLGRYSSVDDLLKGKQILEKVKKSIKIPLVYHCIEKSLFSYKIQKDFMEQVFPIERFMLSPWEKVEK